MIVAKQERRVAAASLASLGRANAQGSLRRALRVALYSHDTMGIGHMRRNLLVARGLLSSGQVGDVLMIAGARQAAMFSMPAGVDCLTLPSICKEASGGYRSRSLQMSLERMTELRSGVIGAALQTYRPDLFIVDKVPRGAEGELDAALCELRRGGATRCILGLREVLDDADVVRREWLAGAFDEAIADYYDAVWVYGDPAVFDPVLEYGFSAPTAKKVHYTGYFDHRALAEGGAGANVENQAAALRLPPGRLMLCLVGGGEDGEAVARAFLSAPLPTDAAGVLVTGPFMPAATRRELQRAAAGDRRRQVIEFLADPGWLLKRADRIVTMGGYNSVTEAISFGKPTLVAPRVAPRREQWLRAVRLEQLGVVSVLAPEAIGPAAIGAWLARGDRPSVAAHALFDFQGLTRLPQLLAELFP